MYVFLINMPILSKRQLASHKPVAKIRANYPWEH